MSNLLFLGAAVLLSTAAAPGDSGHCDSKPFTLKKPVATAPKPAETTPAPKPAPPKVAAATPAKPRKKYQIGCKQPKG